MIHSAKSEEPKGHYPMTRLLATASVIALLSSPAWAWDANTSGKQSPIAQDGGTVNQPIASARSSSVAASQSSARAYGGQATSYGSQQHQNAYGGAGGKSSVANSGNNTFNINTTSQYVDPPAATAATAPASTAADPASDPSSGHRSHGGGGYHGGGSTQVIAPPSPGVALAPAAGAFCPGMGIGAGGSGLTGAGVFTYTWEAPNCTAMQYAQILNAMGHPDAALYVMEQKSDLVKNALKWEAERHEVPAPAQQEPFIDGFCRDNPSLCD